MNECNNNNNNDNNNNNNDNDNNNFDNDDDDDDDADANNINNEQFLERLPMLNMLNCTEQVQIQKYKTHAYKTSKTVCVQTIMLKDPTKQHYCMAAAHLQMTLWLYELLHGCYSFTSDLMLYETRVRTFSFTESRGLLN